MTSAIVTAGTWGCTRSVKMGVDGKFRVCACEYGARFLRRRVMRHHALDLLVFQQFGVNRSDFVDENIRSGAVSDDVLVEARIARDHNRPALVIDTVAVGGLDLVAVVDLESGDTNAVLFVDDTLRRKLVGDYLDAFGRIMFVGCAGADVGRVSPFQVRHQLLRPGRADNVKRRRASAKRPAEPTREPEVGDADRVVGMEVRQKQWGYFAERDFQLPQPDGCAASSIE